MRTHKKPTDLWIDQIERIAYTPIPSSSSDKKIDESGNYIQIIENNGACHLLVETQLL